LLLKKCFFSFVFVSHSYYKVFSLQCLLFALAYWNVVFLKLHFKVWLSFLLQANGACFMNLIWSRHHFLMLKVMVKEKPTLVDPSNVPNIWFQWVDKLLMFGLIKTSFLAFVVHYIQHLEWYSSLLNCQHGLINSNLETFCKNTVLLVTTMDNDEKTRSY